jgi:hypothetical protein
LKGHKKLPLVKSARQFYNSQLLSTCADLRMITPSAKRKGDNVSDLIAPTVKKVPSVSNLPMGQSLINQRHSLVNSKLAILRDRTVNPISNVSTSLFGKQSSSRQRDDDQSSYEDRSFSEMMEFNESEQDFIALLSFLLKETSRLKDSNGTITITEEFLDTAVPRKFRVVERFKTTKAMLEVINDIHIDREFHHSIAVPRAAQNSRLSETVSSLLQCLSGDFDYCRNSKMTTPTTTTATTSGTTTTTNHNMDGVTEGGTLDMEAILKPTGVLLGNVTPGSADQPGSPQEVRRKLIESFARLEIYAHYMKQCTDFLAGDKDAPFPTEIPGIAPRKPTPCDALGKSGIPQEALTDMSQQWDKAEKDLCHNVNLCLIQRTSDWYSAALTFLRSHITTLTGHVPMAERNKVVNEAKNAGSQKAVRDRDNAKKAILDNIKRQEQERQERLRQQQQPPIQQRTADAAVTATNPGQASIVSAGSAQENPAGETVRGGGAIRHGRRGGRGHRGGGRHYGNYQDQRERGHGRGNFNNNHYYNN